MLNKGRFLRHYSKSPLAVSSTMVLLFLAILACGADWIAPHNPYDLTTFFLSDRMKPPAWMQGGTSSFLLGTDDQGRDILSTILFGLRTSFLVGFGAVGLSMLIGSTLGLLAGYFGGTIDSVISRAADVMLSFPAFLIALLLLGLLKWQGEIPVILAISAVFWVRYARVIRGNVLEEKARDYVEAARSLGAGHLRIIFSHLLPNSVSILFVIAAVDVGMVVVLEATLSFLGVGMPLTTPSLGMMIASGYNYLYARIWWVVLFPGAVLALLVLMINLLGDWFRIELNPKMQG
jgi:peptide/nickel transport system permease protein